MLSTSNFIHAGQHVAFQGPAIPLRPRVNEQIPLMVICMDFPDRPAHGLTLDQIDRAIFGPAPSTVDYFREQSRGQFRFTRAGRGVYGWYTSPQNEAWYQSMDAQTNSTISSNFRRTHSIQQASIDVDFAQFDRNGDGRVTPDELAIICIWGDATVSDAASRNTTPAQLPVSGIVLDLLVAATWEGRANMATVAHELAHTVFGLQDVYDTGAPLTENISSFSLMADDMSLLGQMGIPMLDPWARLHLGWLNATVVTGGEIGNGALRQIRDAETSGDALILPIYGRGTTEYFIIENRFPRGGITYDAGFGPGARGRAHGLAVWHICEDKPQMNQVIRLVRATGPVPANQASGVTPNDHESLFDAASATRGYNWNDQSAPRNTRTRSGARTGIGVWRIPIAAQAVQLWVGNPYDALVEVDRAIDAEMLALRQEIEHIQTIALPQAQRDWTSGRISRATYLSEVRELNGQVTELRRQLDGKANERLVRMSAEMDSVRPPTVRDTVVERHR